MSGQVLNVPQVVPVDEMATKAYVNAMVTPERQRWFYAASKIIADPGTGHARFDLKAPNQASTVTQIALSVITKDATDITNPLLRYRTGDEIYVQVASDSTKWARFILTASPVLQAPPTWQLLNVQYLGSGGSIFISEVELVFQFRLVGDIFPPVV